MTRLVKDKEAMLAFYDHLAENWQHIRTSNPIESVFAIVRLRNDQKPGIVAAGRQYWQWHLN
jgi:transposase-like protein